MLIADLHIHSKYSRATSGECIPEYLALWARRKGIDLIGTGDFTHPAWREELARKLEPAEEGLYRLREPFRLPDGVTDAREPRFLLTGEISSIYKKNGRVRKVHNLILLPGLPQAEALAHRLEAVGNLHSDGRPILGLDSRDLLEITLDCCPEAVFIPAHIWTPHFSLFGAFSGFDTIEECFEDLTPHIHAVETGLSSDPPMNWRLSALDRFALVSHSDAHSPSRLGREATLFDTALSYPAIAQALQGQGAPGLAGTIEFFPEEGKYHFDGHRNCGVCLSPVEAQQQGGLCPVCGKRLTTGVLHRVEQLADRPEGASSPQGRPFERLVPLPEVIAASTGLGAGGTRVADRYQALLHALGPEFYILRQAPLGEIEAVAGPCVAEGIRRMRAGQVERSPGFDGEYGKIHLLDAAEIDRLSGQLCLFPGEEKPAGQAAPRPKKAAQPGSPAAAALQQGAGAEGQGLFAGLNPQQRAAATAPEGAVSVVAGPGTGKTRTLVARIAYLVEQCGVPPAQITAVTFTNRAAAEMRRRLEGYFGGKRRLKGMTIGTFHAICLSLLAPSGSRTVLDAYEAQMVAQEVTEALGLRCSAARLLREISAYKNSGGNAPGQTPPEGFAAYQQRLAQYGVWDYDDLLREALALFEGEPDKTAWRPFTHLLVDEFQDINPLQFRLLAAWGARSKSWFVIGDPDQAIYGFRGSDARCFARWEQAHPEAQRFCLEENYRSTPQVLACALPVINQNEGAPRQLRANRPAGPAVRLLTAPDEFAEAVFIAKEINRMVGGVDMLAAHSRAGQEGRGFSEIAVLYRTHRQAELLEHCLQVEGIPYLVGGRDATLREPTVRGALGFFRALLAPQDRLSLRLCLQFGYHCSGALLAALPDGPWENPAQLQGLLPPALREEEGLARWADQAERFLPRLAREKPARLLEDWMEENHLAGDPPLQRLLHRAVLAAGLPAFLQDLALGEEGDLTRSGNRRYTPDAVSLSTLHGAKGLEYPVVFLCGLRRGVLPLELPGRAADLAEERRLFYVGITRAQEELVLLTGPEPSSFLDNLPQTALQTGGTTGPKAAPEGRQLRFF